MTGRAYMGEVLIYTSLAGKRVVIGQTSECTKREFEKTFRVHASSCNPMKKSAMKMKGRNKEKMMCA